MTYWGNKRGSCLQLEAGACSHLKSLQLPLGLRNLRQHVPQSQQTCTQTVTVEESRTRAGFNEWL